MKRKERCRFADLLNDFKKYRKLKQRHPLFRPDTMCMNPEEFEEALLQYASEKGMKIVITKRNVSGIYVGWNSLYCFTGTFHVLVR